MTKRPTPDERVRIHTRAAAEALRTLKAATGNADRLAAAKALESASCQLRRALVTLTESD